MNRLAQTLSVTDLACVPVLERLRAEQPARLVRVELGDNERPLEAGLVDDVLYVPSLHLQVWRGRIVPHEANTDDDAFPELLGLARSGKIMAHAIFTGVATVDEDVCVIGNIYSHNFFHFVEELYKVMILERAGFAGKYAFSEFPSRLAQTLPRFSTEFLQLLGVNSERLIRIGRPTILRRAWFTTRISHADTPHYRGVFFALRQALLAAASGPGLGPRLWIDRRHDRVVVNASQVHECVGRHGFAIVDMADLSVARQIAAAHQAQILAGPHGAGHIHGMFLKERSTVIECFSPDYINPCCLEIYGSLQHRYLQMVQTTIPGFEYPYGGAVEINMSHLELVLSKLPPPVKGAAVTVGNGSRQRRSNSEFSI